MSNLQYTEGRIIVKIHREGKMGHTFADGTVIRIERDMNNLDNAYVKQTIGTVISGHEIPEGALILFHFNAMHPVNEIFNHGVLSGDEIASDIGVYSLPETECFLWKMPGASDWNPVGAFILAERVYSPYQGTIEGIEPELIPDVLYIKTGELVGWVCHTVKAADYRLIFRNEKGVDEELVRCRHSEDESFDREELIALSHELTDQVRNGQLLIGINPSTAKKLNDVNSECLTANVKIPATSDEGDGG